MMGVRIMIHLDFSSKHPEFRVDKYVIVIVVRGNRKNRILYHSGLLYFYDPEERDYLVNKIRERFQKVNLEIYDVDIKDAHLPPGDIDKPKGTYWCPFCQSFQKFKAAEGGYLHCPICGISDSEYYVKRYNNLWHNMDLKKRMVKNKNFVKRRRK
jgi:hypothetical protein